MIDIEMFIATIRNSFLGSETVYTIGSCYQFYLILKEIFNDAEPYCNSVHIISKIGDKFYDITGEITGDELDYYTIMSSDLRKEARENWKYNIFEKCT